MKARELAGTAAGAARAEEYGERILRIHGVEVRLSTYRIGDLYHCHVDNVSPGATIARGRGGSREEAESRAVAGATFRIEAGQRPPAES